MHVACDYLSVHERNGNIKHLFAVLNKDSSTETQGACNNDGR